MCNRIIAGVSLTGELRDNDIFVSKEGEEIGCVTFTLSEGIRFDIAPNKNFVSLTARDLTDLNRFFKVIENL